MLVKFTTGNFLSVKDKISLDLQAKAISELRPDNIFATSVTDLGLLKSAVLYGSNSSGKSNLLKALSFMKWFILNSSKELQADEEIDVECFRLSTKTIDQPSFFEIEFIQNNQKYRYGFKVDKYKVYEEWLYYTKKIKEYKLFERFRQEIILQANFTDGGDEIKKLTRENALFLSVAAQFNGELAIALLKVIKDIRFLSGTNDQRNFQSTINLLNIPRFSKSISNFISSANLGFNEIKTEQIQLTEEILGKSGIPKEIQKLILKEKNEEVLVRTKHTIYNEKNEPEGVTYFDLFQNESLGTRKFFSLAGPIVESLLKGTVLIIDEFDARLHPILSKAIVNLFNSKNNNPLNAQLVFATHNSSYLNNKIFRRDQIIMTKKDKYGATSISTLLDLKIRKDASFEKDYLLGKYEAVPTLDISNQLQLFDNQNENENIIETS